MTQILFLKAIKDGVGMALYGNPPRWHKVTKDSPAPSNAHHVVFSHYDVAAAKKLNDAPHLKDAHPDNHHAEVKKLSAEMQAEASASAAFSMWKKAALEGKNPTPGQWKGFFAQDDGKKLAATIEVQKKFGNVDHLKIPEGLAPADSKSVDPAPEAAGVPADQPAQADPGPQSGAPASSDGGFEGDTAEYYKNVAQKIADLAEAGDHAALDAMKENGLKPNAKGKVGHTWKGKTVNSKKLLALHDAALQHALQKVAIKKPESGPVKPIPISEASKSSMKLVPKETLQTFVDDLYQQPGYEEFLAYAKQVLAEGEPKKPEPLPKAEPLTEADKKNLNNLADQPALLQSILDGYVGLPKWRNHAAYISELLDKAPASVASPYKKLSGPGKMKEGKIIPVSVSPESAEKLLGLPSGSLVAPEGEKYSQSFYFQDAAGFSFSVYSAGGMVRIRPVFNSYLSDTHADQANKFADWLEGNKPGTLPEPAFKKESSAAYVDKDGAIKTTADNAKLADAFDAMKLPESNSNHKTVNKQVEALKAAVLSGDVEKVKALKFGSNNYGKKLKAAQEKAIASMGGAAAPVTMSDDAGPGVAMAEQALPEIKLHSSGIPYKPDANGSAILQGQLNSVAKLIELSDPKGLKNIIGAFADAKSTNDKTLLAYAKAGLAFVEKKPASTPSVPELQYLPDGKPVKPSIGMFHMTLDEIEGYIQSGLTLSLKDSISNLTGLNGLGAKTALAYANAGLNYLQEKAKEGIESLQDKDAKVTRGWSLNMNNVGFDGEPTLVADTEGGGNLYVAYSSVDGDYQVGSMDISSDDVDYKNFKTASEAAAYVADHSALPGMAPTVAEVQSLSQGKDTSPSPKEGDTKPGANGGMLVFHDGRWHKQDAPAQTPETVGPSIADLQASGNPPAAPATITVNKKTYHNTLAGSSKFWSIYVTDDGHLVTEYGKIGAKKPQSTVKKFNGKAAATFEMNKLINKKVAGGYYFKEGGDVEVPNPSGESAAPAPAPEPVKLSKFQVEVAFSSAGLNAYNIQMAKQAKAALTKAKDAALAGDLTSLKMLKTSIASWNAPKTKTVIDNLIASLEKAGASGVQPAAAAAPAATFTSSMIESVDGWKDLGGQGGYTDGSFHTDPSGQKWYVKFHADGESGAKSEALALQLYKAAGLDVPEMKVITKGGKFGTASKVIEGLAEDKAALQAGTAHSIFAGFAADAWLANWDTVGNNPAAGKGFDNIQFAGGKAYRIDAGGALGYKGTGKKKSAAEWGDSVVELKTLLDGSINPNTAKAFGKMSQADIAASVAKVLAVSDQQIVDLVSQFGPGNSTAKMALANKLIARKNSMAAQYPQAAAKAAAPKSKVKVKPPKAVDPNDTSWVKLKAGEKIVESGVKFGVQFVKVEVPAKGFHADGIPKPFEYTYSSSKFVNEANTADIKAIYDLALSSKSADAVRNIKFDEIDKASGQKTGKKLSIDEHPSKKYLKEYVTQVAAELEAQLAPTFRIEHRGSFSDSYSSAAAEIAARVKTLDYGKFKSWKPKAADYLVLDKDAGAGIPVPDAGSFKNVEPTDAVMVDFKAKSDESFNKLNASEKSACKAYTGSSYAAWNEALRTGDTESSSFKSAQTMVKAFEKAAVELPDGIMLHRGIGVGGETYDSIVGAVIQDGSFQSCSYGKTAAFSGKSSQLRLHITKGVKGIMATTFSNFGSGEREVILHPNCRFVVMKVDKGSPNRVDVLVLPHED